MLSLEREVAAQKHNLSYKHVFAKNHFSSHLWAEKSAQFHSGFEREKGRKKEKHSSSHGLLSKRERNKDSRNTEHCRSQKKVVEREEEQRKKTLLFCVFLRISSIRRFTRCHPHYESVTSVPITHRRSRPGRRMLDACCACCEGLRLQLNEPCACSCARQPFLRA